MGFLVARLRLDGIHQRAPVPIDDLVRRAR